MTFKAQNILLVEDNAADACLIQRMLEESLSFVRYDLTTVARLSEALDQLGRGSFSAVLLDLNLMDSSGVETVAALYGNHPDIPIIVYSGADDPQLRKDALLCGARHYVVKGREGGFAVKCIIEQATAA